uniref:EF-hand domain-containing protein n=1 Tax=Denticeps clupeoides TaxID=299321 RepID=A0AAY4CD98_9TELE
EKSIIYPNFYMHQFNNSRELDESIRKAFSMLDRDGSGYIEWNEIKYLLSVVPGSAPLVPLSDEEVEAMMDAVDTDGDGRINFSEFSNMVKLEKRPRK